MKEADRKLASAIVVAAWATVSCAIAGSLITGHGRAHEMSVAATSLGFEAPTTMNAIHIAAQSVERETKCLADAIYHEARSESEAGQLAVAEVVINRVNSGKYPDSICGVVYQGSERVTGCQFSFTCDGSLKQRIDPIAYTRAQRVAKNVVMGHGRALVGSATYYHADYVAPAWASAYEQTARIGRHIFYADTSANKRG